MKRRSTLRHGWLVMVPLLFVSSGCATLLAPRPGSQLGAGERHSVTAPQVASPVALSAKERAAVHYLQALSARIDGDYDRARKETLRAVGLDPRAPRLRRDMTELYIRTGQLRRALDHALALRALDPDNPEYMMLTGGLLVALQLYDDAIEEYRAVVGVSPNREEALLQLGTLYNRVGNHERAIRTLRHIVAISPDSYLSNFALGKALASASQYEDAVRSFRYASKLSPGNPQAHLYVGYCFQKLGNRKRAAESYAKAAEFNPALSRLGLNTLDADVEEGPSDEVLDRFAGLVDLEGDPLRAQSDIGLLRFRRGDYVAAATYLNIVLGARPGDYQVRYWLALTYDRLGSVEGTAQALRGIPPESLRYLDARIYLANVLQENGRSDDAIAALEEALDSHPDDPEVLRPLITLYRDAGQLGKALEVGTKLVELDPENDGYLYGLAWLQDLEGNTRKAIALLRKSLLLNPRNGAALNHLGYTFAEQGVNLHEAEALIRRALDIHPNDGAFVDSLGWVFYRRGDFEDAAFELERAVRLAGRDPVIVEHLANVYAKLGRNRDAVRLYRDCEARTEDEDQRARVLQQLDELEETIRSAANVGGIR